jgi:dolichol kinase
MSIDDNAHPTRMSTEGRDEKSNAVFLSRLPSPYHRRKSGLIAPLTPIIPPDLPPSRQEEGSGSGHASLSEQSRRNIASPSESGTEADDEGYGLVIKALPAPPYKPRKGLRRRTATDGEEASPPLTPTKLDNEVLRLSDVGIHELGAKEADPATQESLSARAKGVKRRRAEILRRVVEGALVALSGALVMGTQRILWTLSKPQRSTLLGSHSSHILLTIRIVTVLSHMGITAAIYLMYPLRLVRYSRRERLSQKPFWHCIRISAAFDPARYIYPPVLPGIVALSLFKENPTALLLNLVLGIAALPPHLFGTVGHGYNQYRFSQHWLLSMIPAALLQNLNSSRSILQYTSHVTNESCLLDSLPEATSFLFPLHANIVPLLNSFTTTSLLPAELQLLSVALINLLFLSSSPHSIILSIILWVGGLGTIVFSSPVIRWGVALARVRRWRFQRAGRIIQAQQTFIRALNEAVRRKGKPRREREIVESDADDDHKDILSQPRPQLDLPTLKTEVLNALKQNFFPTEDDGSRSAVEKPVALAEKDWPDTPQRNDKRRRHTVSNDPTFRKENLTATPRRNRRKLQPVSFFSSLTPGQAAIRKWSYAAYVYLIIALLIVGPIRHLVSKLALDGAEPFGWAIGYLGGNMRELRFWIVYSGLDKWITLPPMLSESTGDILAMGRASYFRDVLVGAANTRLLICAYCLCVLAIGMVAVLQLTTIVEVDTRRKVFHGMMVAMLLPTIPIDPPFSSLALTIILAIFLLLDLLRASCLPPLSKPIASFLTPYVDGRDLRGPVVISHIFLLIGCAVPLWLSLAGVPLAGIAPWRAWDAQSRDVSMVAGVICVGMGDAAASLIGRRFGRHKWPWSGGKSLEGSFAFAVAVTCGLLFGKAWLALGQWTHANPASSWLSSTGKAAAAATAAGLMEAVLTGGNDNVIVPVVLWVFVKALML